MELVDLRNGYWLTGFNDFESALSATEQLCEKGYKVAYLNETAHVREAEARGFAMCVGDQNDRKYQNYHFARMNQAKENAMESFKTAVEVLERNSSCCAKFVVVLKTKR